MSLLILNNFFGSFLDFLTFSNQPSAFLALSDSLRLLSFLLPTSDF
jgi:hypothetical protein